MVRIRQIYSSASELAKGRKKEKLDKESFQMYGYLTGSDLLCVNV
jgi:hypothetical protein